MTHFEQHNDTLFCFVKPTEEAEVIAARLRTHPAFFVDVDTRLPTPMPHPMPGHEEPPMQSGLVRAVLGASL